MNPVKVGLLGLGTVGGGTLNVLVRNATEIARRAGREIVVAHAAARDFRPEGLEGLDSVEVCDDAFAVVDNPEIDIIVVIGIVNAIAVIIASGRFGITGGGLRFVNIVDAVVI